MMMYSGFVAMIMAISMVFTSAPSVNKDGDLYERAQSAYTNADVTVSISADSSIEEASLDILDEMLLSEQAEYGSDSPVSIKSILSGIFDSGMVLNAAYNISSGGKVGNIQLALDSDIALALNQSLAVSADVGFSLWADYDFTSLENFKCELIILSPADTRYILCDLALMLTEEEKQAVISGSFLSDGTMQLPMPNADLYEKSLDILRKNSAVTIDEKNHGQIVMTGENMKNYLIEAFELSMTSATDSLLPSGGGIQSAEDALMLAVIQPVKELLSSLDLFDNEKAAVYDYYFDDNKNLTGSSEVVNFSFNLKDTWTKFDEFNDLMSSEMIGYEDSDEIQADFEIDEKEDPWHKLPEGRDDFIFSFTSDTKYNRYDETVNIEKPVLTETNTRNMYEEYISEEIYAPGYDSYYPTDAYVYVSEYGNAFWRNEITVPLRGFFEELCYGSEEITFDNGKITVKSNDGTELFETIEITLGSNIVTKDGEVFTLSAPVYTLDGTTRLTEEFFSVLWGGEFDYIDVYTINRDENGFYYETGYCVCIPLPESFPFE